MSANGKYGECNAVNDVYWRELGVRFDAINEIDTDQKLRQFRVALDVMSLDELKELADVAEISLTDPKNKEQSKNELALLSGEKLLLELLLRDFQNRKKRTIPAYYESNSIEKIYNTPLAQLHHLFNQNPSQLFSLLTYYLWTVRGTGDVYTMDKSIVPGKARKVLTEKGFEVALCNSLYKASGEKNEFRIYSYAIVGDYRHIAMLYKQVNDTSIADYKQAKRNQEVNMILFELNSENDTVEIKAKAQFEGWTIKKYVEDTFDGVLSAYKTEVYSDYDKTTFVETVLSGKTASGKPVSDFLVEKVVFRSSPLKNSPEVTLQLKNIDIWPSVIDAHDNGCVNIDSVKDLASLSFKSSEVRRTIRSVIKDDGNVVFTMDDSLIEKEKLESIKAKFFEKFGVPMFQEISNDKFSDGQADLIDYVLGQRDPSKHRQEYTRETYEALVKQGLLVQETDIYVECINKECPYEAKISDETSRPNECPLCDCELRAKTSVTVQIHASGIRKEVRKKLTAWCGDGEWTMNNESNMTYGNAVHKFYNLGRISDQKPLQILIADQTIDSRLLNKLYKLMTPLIVVFMGQQEKFIEKYSNECIQAVSFGKLFVQSDNEIKQLFESIYGNLELRAKNYVASAANKAYHSMCRLLCQPEDMDKSYTPGDLEDDGYALLKDLLPNSVKWGKQQSGKQLPEGVFSVSYVRKGTEKKKYAFSFDFKLTYKNEGYPLEISERRKAVQYVRDLNDSDLITSYAEQRQLSGHIFISNCFSEAQIKTTIEYFEEQLAESVISKPIFITTETLVHLHSKYREYYEEVELAKNYFMHWLYEALMNKSRRVTMEHVDAIFKKLSSKEFRETGVINMPILTEEMTQKNAI